MKVKRKIQEESKGITLIALVITIIVLLILAAVTISTLTGDNGILTQAGNVKTKNKNAEAEEQVKLAVMGSYGEDGKIDLDQLNKNLSKIDGYESGEITKLPATITVGGKNIEISSAGNVTIAGEKVTISEAQTAGTVFEKETTLEDKYGNQIKIPAGFKIASDSAIEVTKGIVIEDAKYTKTIGSQFVWIPVGEVTGSVNGVEKTETIKLSRYTFGSDGTPKDQGDNIIDPYYQELATSDYGNAVAKDIEAFKSSANNNHGYYIGRYEAGVTGYDSVTTINSNGETNWTGYTGDNTQLVCKSKQQVWNYITQNKASEVSKDMYVGKEFTSDLINSYSWDTAIVFIQKFGEESNSATYSRTTGYSSTSPSAPQNTGTNILSATEKVDKQCNIFDMAGNCFEWLTETYSRSGCPCVNRGGIYSDNTIYTGYRSSTMTTLANSRFSFRPLLYL